MTATTARQSSSDVDDQEMTTADYARMVTTGKWGKSNQRPATQDTDNKEPAGSTADNDVARGTTAVSAEPQGKLNDKRKPRREKAVHSSEEAEHRSNLMDAAHWTPGDYTAISPSPLREAVAEHGNRSRAMEAAAGRFFYGMYAAPATAVGVTLNIFSWTTAKLSALINDPKHAQRPGSLYETITLHTERANHIRFTPLKVLYCGAYATPATLLSALLNAIAWLTAHSAVALNDPKRLGRVLLGVLFVTLVVGGFTVML